MPQGIVGAQPAFLPELVGLELASISLDGPVQDQPQQNAGAVEPAAANATAPVGFALVKPAEW